MPPEFDLANSRRFIEVAVQRELLTEEQARTLMSHADQQSVNSSQLAVETGILKPIEAEIVQAFAAPLDLAPGYELLDVLGHGALGVVFRARQPRLQRDVAIKAIREARLSQATVVARFQQEGAAIGRLHHPNIVSAFDSGSHRGRLYLVMEFVRGCDLRRKLDEGPLDAGMALAILRQVTAGLAHALSHQIIHRDIKPGNIILTEAPAGYDLPEGVPLAKIADFGLARLTQSADAGDQDARLTLTGAAMGTPMYCAPEQLTGDEIDHRADIYALGATFFRMLTGEPPYEPGKISKVIAAKVTGQSPRLDQLPANLDPAVRTLLLDMMQHDADDRISDYETLMQRIDQVYHGERVTPMIGGVQRGSRRDRTVRRVLVTSLAIVLLAAVMGPWLFGAFRTPPQPSMVPNGRENHLFDGRSVTGWTARDGLWSGGADVEGGAVLIGKGSAVRHFPLRTLAGTAGAVGMRVGIDLQQAGSAEVHFGFTGEDNFSDSARKVARLTPDEAVLGKRDGIEEEFEPIGRPQVVKDVQGDAPRYHEFRIEKHVEDWFVYFNGDLLGYISADPRENRLAMQLVAADGTVHFENPSVFGLIKKAASE